MGGTVVTDVPGAEGEPGDVGGGGLWVWVVRVGAPGRPGWEPPPEWATTGTAIIAANKGASNFASHELGSTAFSLSDLSRPVGAPGGHGGGRATTSLHANRARTEVRASPERTRTDDPGRPGFGTVGSGRGRTSSLGIHPTRIGGGGEHGGCPL
ncbi:MAG: hypothetical protein ABS81_11680 [Pseudonocardia sp. SCN 72-86]|nr:MAG: hypothetical protein ABS81_11680 [Pseudonocardia sp. SCN 72-86]